MERVRKVIRNYLQIYTMMKIIIGMGKRRPGSQVLGGAGTSECRKSSTMTGLQPLRTMKKIIVSE